MDRLDHMKWHSYLSNFTRDRIVYHQEYKDYPISGEAVAEHSCYRLQRACCQFALGMQQVPLLAIVSSQICILKLIKTFCVLLAIEYNKFFLQFFCLLEF